MVELGRQLGIEQVFKVPGEEGVLTEELIGVDSRDIQVLDTPEKQAEKAGVSSVGAALKKFRDMYNMGKEFLVIDEAGRTGDLKGKRETYAMIMQRLLEQGEAA